MANLKTNYKDDILDADINTMRKFNMINNSDGTVSFKDVTTYTQQGDKYGSAQINQQNTKINEHEDSITQINNDLNANSKPFKFDYDAIKDKYGYTIDGTFHPFSSGAVHLGRYSANTTINVANLGATSKNQFLVVAHSGSWSAFSNPGSANITSNGGYSEATWSLSGNTLTITAPTVQGGHSCAGGAAYSGPHPCTYDVYFVGDIEEM